MERELEKRIFMITNYESKNSMEEDIKEYIKILKKAYPKAIITTEFYKGQNILVRATEICNKSVNTKQNNKERNIDDWYIRQRGER